MAGVNIDPIYPGTIHSGAFRISNDVSLHDLIVGGDYGTRVEHLSVWNNHTLAATVNIMFYKAATGVSIIMVQKAMSTLTYWDVMSTLVSDVDKKYLVLMPGDKIQVQTPGAVAGNVDCYTDGADY